MMRVRRMGENGVDRQKGTAEKDYLCGLNHS